MQRDELPAPSSALVINAGGLSQCGSPLIGRDRLDQTGIVVLHVRHKRIEFVTDSPLEGTGFEPPVPSGAAALWSVIATGGERGVRSRD